MTDQFHIRSSVRESDAGLFNLVIKNKGIFVKHVSIDKAGTILKLQCISFICDRGA